MPLRAFESVALDQRVEVVARVLAEQQPRQSHGAEHRGRELLAEAAELVAHEAVVEASVVRDEQPPVEALANLAAQVLEGRSALDHLVADAGEGFDGRRDAHARVDEAAPRLDDLAAVEQHDADFGDPVVDGHATRGLEVDAGDGAAQRGRAERDIERRPDRHGRQSSPDPSSVSSGA